MSQALGFESVNGTKFVLRIAESNDDFLADEYAYRQFGTQLPIPRVVDMRNFSDTTYYCITEKAPGINSNNITDVAYFDYKDFKKLELEKKLLTLNAELISAARQAGITLPRPWPS